MRNFSTLFIFFVMSFLLGACSSLSENSTEGYSNEGLNSEGVVQEELGSFDFRPPIDLSQAFSGGEVNEKKLTSLVEQAKNQGGEALEYLANALFLKSSHASMRQDSQNSLALMKALLAIRPDHDQVLRKYAVELIRVGNLGDAESIITQIYDSVERKDENIALILGGIYTALDRRDKAQEIYSEVLELNASNREACIFLSKSHAMEGNFQRSDKILSECQRSARESEAKAVFSYYRGTLGLEMEEQEKAIKHFEQSLEYNPQFYQAAIALGMVYEESELWVKAMSTYEDYLENDGHNRSILSQLVQVYFANGVQEKALPYAKRLMSLDPSNLNLKVRVGVLYSDLGETQKAIEVFEEVLEKAPQADKVLYYVGALYQQEGKADRAVSYYSQIPESSSLFHEGAIQIGEILRVQANEKYSSDSTRDPAQEDKESEVSSPKDKLIHFVDTHYDEHNPTLTLELHVILASFFEEQFEYEKAALVLERVSEFENFSSHHEYYLAALFEKAGESEKATKLIRAILEDDPDHAHALNFLGYTMVENEENLSEAYRLIKRAIELEPEDGYIRDSLGWYYYKMGELDKALKEVKKARSLLEVEDMVINKHLAIIYKEMKEYSKAKKFYEEALKLCKADYEREKLHEALGDLEQLRVPTSVNTAQGE